jgi:hypothetical protein
MGGADPSNPNDLRNDPHDLNNALAQRLEAEANARMSWGGAMPPDTTAAPMVDVWHGGSGYPTQEPTIASLPPFDWAPVGRRLAKILALVLLLSVALIVGAYLFDG